MEIANQAAIFKSSDRCIAWTNDVETWEGVENALDWMCMKYLSITSKLEAEESNMILEKVSNAASGPVSVMRATQDIPVSV
jgi:hypothetical protein